MLLIEVTIQGIVVKLHEYKENRNIIGRSVYVMGVRGERGQEIIDLGDNRNYALHEFNSKVQGLTTSFVVALQGCE